MPKCATRTLMHGWWASETLWYYTVWGIYWQYVSYCTAGIETNSPVCRCWSLCEGADWPFTPGSGTPRPGHGMTLHLCNLLMMPSVVSTAALPDIHSSVFHISWTTSLKICNCLFTELLQESVSSMSDFISLIGRQCITCVSVKFWRFLAHFKVICNFVALCSWCKTLPWWCQSTRVAPLGVPENVVALAT